MVRPPDARVLSVLLAALGAPAAGASPLQPLPDVGSRERMEAAPPDGLPARRERAVTLAGDAVDVRVAPAAERMFQALDDNRDGAVDAAEQARARARVAFEFADVDADRDGRISRAEYQTWWQRRRAPAR